jgi:hypothetical protein
MKFKQAKGIIRAALAGASDEKLCELLDAARAGMVPWNSCQYCVAGRLYPERGRIAWMPESDAYAVIGGVSPDAVPREISLTEDRRQRVLIPMLLAEIKRRNRTRETARAIVSESLEVGTIAELFGV